VRQQLVPVAVERRRIDAKRSVRQRLRRQIVAELSVLHRIPGRRQVRERFAVLVELGLLLGGRLREALRAGEEAVQVVEAAVLGVDDDDVLDPREALAAASRAAEYE